MKMKSACMKADQKTADGQTGGMIMKQWMKNVRKVVPYTPGEQPKDKNIIKLNTNENPYPPSPRVRDLCQQIGDLRLYPDPAASELVEAIADYKGLDKDQVFVGVGSDDVLAIAFLTFFNSDRPILFPDITYSFYDVWADLFRIPYETRPLDEHFHIRKEDYLGANGGVIFPNPNAPTGVSMPLEEVEAIVAANRDVVVILDEAYVDFGGETALPLIDRYDNLLLVQTFSKSRSLAGLRIGYAMGCPDLIKAMCDVKYSFNSYTMNRPSILLGKASIEDEDYFRKTVDRIIATRTWFARELQELGFHFPESRANFIFASHESIPAKSIFTAARDAGIYVRYFEKPRIDHYLRITIGTDEEMRKLLQFLKTFIENAK